MAVTEKRLAETQHQIPREEIVIPITRSTEGEGKSFYPGDALDISLSSGSPTLVVFTHRRHGVVWGWLDGYTLDDIETWSAKVGDWDGTAVRLIPVDRQPIDFDPNEIERCAKHDRVGCVWCIADAEREGHQAVRIGLEDRAYIEEAQS